MSYGWSTVFTLAAWFAGLVIDANVRVGDLGLRTVLPVIVMGCCVMKYIKDNAYYFFYEPQKVCVLNYDFVATIPEKAEGYIIYADRCTLSEQELQQLGITFKKIPRDIVRV